MWKWFSQIAQLVVGAVVVFVFSEVVTITVVVAVVVRGRAVVVTLVVVFVITGTVVIFSFATNAVVTAVVVIIGCSACICDFATAERRIIVAATATIDVITIFFILSVLSLLISSALYLVNED